MEPWTSPAWRESVKDKVYFTEPFTQHCETMVFKKGESYEVKKPNELMGKKVGTVQNFTYPSYKELFKNKSIHRVSGSNEHGVLRMLTHGRSDLAFMDKIAASFLIKREYANTLEMKNTFDCVPITFMFNKKNTAIGKEISDILQKLKSDNTIIRIKNKFR